MNLLKKLAGIALLSSASILMLSAAPANAYDPSTTKETKAIDADNSKLNERDKGGNTLTPQDQPNNDTDRELLAHVRRAITQDKGLSTHAHNVKVLVTDRVVTLRGPVLSEVEKTNVGKIAANVKGISTVHNELEIKAK